MCLAADGETRFRRAAAEARRSTKTLCIRQVVLVRGQSIIHTYLERTARRSLIASRMKTSRRRKRRHMRKEEKVISQIFSSKETRERVWMELGDFKLHIITISELGAGRSQSLSRSRHISALKKNKAPFSET